MAAGAKIVFARPQDWTNSATLTSLQSKYQPNFQARIMEQFCMTEFKNKTAFITGGASGIGLEIARSLALRGTNIMLADINESELANAKSDLAKTGRQIETVVCDVADEAAVRAAAAATEAAFGNVHFLVNNAGVAIGGQAGSVNLDDWRWIVDINLMGVAYGVEIFTPLIKASGGGHIVNVASMAGLINSRLSFVCFRFPSPLSSLLLSPAARNRPDKGPTKDGAAPRRMTRPDLRAFMAPTDPPAGGV